LVDQLVPAAFSAVEASNEENKDGAAPKLFFNKRFESNKNVVRMESEEQRIEFLP